MLLSQSQVSIIISSFIIVSCTAALFLSGYIIQQRTVNQLRAAIKSSDVNPSPRAHVPERFKTSTITLKDGTVVVMESAAEAEANDREPLVLEVKTTVQQKKEHELLQSQQQQQQQQQQIQQQRFMVGDGALKVEKIQYGPQVRIETERVLKWLEEDEAKLDAEGIETEKQRNLRRLTEKNQMNPDPGAEDQNPMSRAQRRKLIREEINKLSHESEPVYYQRRLW